MRWLSKQPLTSFKKVRLKFRDMTCFLKILQLTDETLQIQTHVCMSPKPSLSLCYTLYVIFKKTCDLLWKEGNCMLQVWWRFPAQSPFHRICCRKHKWGWIFRSTLGCSWPVIECSGVTSIRLFLPHDKGLFQWVPLAQRHLIGLAETFSKLQCGLRCLLFNPPTLLSFHRCEIWIVAKGSSFFIFYEYFHQ